MIRIIKWFQAMLNEMNDFRPHFMMPPGNEAHEAPSNGAAAYEKLQMRGHTSQVSIDIRHTVNLQVKTKDKRHRHHEWEDTPQKDTQQSQISGIRAIVMENTNTKILSWRDTLPKKIKDKYKFEDRNPEFVWSCYFGHIIYCHDTLNVLQPWWLNYDQALDLQAPAQQVQYCLTLSLKLSRFEILISSS